MKAVEFTTELSGATVLHIPAEVAAQLPKAGKARVIVLTDEGDEEAEWRQGAYTSSFSGMTRQKMRSTTPCADMFGEIFICQFPFTSGAASKIRPALVLFDLGYRHR